jgi:hypothetical protein
MKRGNVICFDRGMGVARATAFDCCTTELLVESASTNQQPLAVAEPKTQSPTKPPEEDEQGTHPLHLTIEKQNKQKGER